MDLGKIDKVLEKLLELHYIEKSGPGYKFTDTGRFYTKQKSNWFLSKFACAIFTVIASPSR